MDLFFCPGMRFPLPITKCLLKMIKYLRIHIMFNNCTKKRPTALYVRRYVEYKIKLGPKFYISTTNQIIQTISCGSLYRQNNAINDHSWIYISSSTLHSHSQPHIFPFIIYLPSTNLLVNIIQFKVILFKIRLLFNHCTINLWVKCEEYRNTVHYVLFDPTVKHCGLMKEIPYFIISS